MFVHTVFFWLKGDLSRDEMVTFKTELEKLTSLANVEKGYCGTPTYSERDVVDQSYSYGLTVIFKDVAAHDAYQVDPDHKAFIEKCGHMWERVLVYDYQ